jgi:methylase of polypeptide subunit release factors
MSEPSSPAADTALADLARTLVAGGYRFVTATPATHARVNARSGNEQAHSLIDVFGWSRPFEPGLLPPALLELMRQGGVLATEDGLCRSRVRLSTLHGMSFLHSAYPTSAADAVFFGPDTYRFADAIASELAQGRPVRRAVDIGSGAGPGGIVVARARPEAEVFMADINPAALRLARINAALNLPPGASSQGSGRVQAMESNLLAAIPGSFDLIVANPPYMVDPAERAYRHGGGPLGAGLSLAILDTALERLAPGGTLVLYTGAAVVNGDDPFQSAAIARISDDRFSWSYWEVDPDVFGEELDAAAYAHADRIAAVVLTVSREE